MGSVVPWWEFASRAADLSGPAPQTVTAMTVRFKPHVHQRLMRLSGVATEQAGKRVSFNSLVNGILEDALDQIEETIVMQDRPVKMRDGARYTPPAGRRLFRRRRTEEWPPSETV